MRLSGRSAVVTGAGGGIGRAYAHALSAEGASVIVNDVGPGGQAVVDEIVAKGGRAVSNIDDVASFAGAQNIIDAAIEHYGAIDILVANAGILRAAPIHEYSERDWADTLAVHANGTFNVYRHAVPHMMTQNSGSIITTGAVPDRYFPGLAAYRAAKAAILVLTLSAAQELAGYNININSIMPGSTDTPMQRAFVSSLGEKAKLFSTPSVPETVPPLGIFLCTDEGREISGHAFQLDGDTGIKVATSFGENARMVAPGVSWSHAELAAALPRLLARPGRA